MPLTNLDRKLLTDLLNGQSGAWKLFVDRYTPLVLQVIQHTAHAHSLKLNADDVEDLCADTMTELLVRDMAALRTFRGRCSLATFLGVIARRIVVRKLAEGGKTLDAWQMQLIWLPRQLSQYLSPPLMDIDL